jgi:F-type H+/Na+-transporting ATPase subunit alpha
LILFAGTNGFLDKVPVKHVFEWQDQFLAYMREQKPEVRAKLVREKKVSKDLEAELRQAIADFQPQFKAK